MSVFRHKFRHPFAESETEVPSLMGDSPAPDALTLQLPWRANGSLHDGADDDATWTIGQLDELLNTFGLPPLDNGE